MEIKVRKGKAEVNIDGEKSVFDAISENVYTMGFDAGKRYRRNPGTYLVFCSDVDDTLAMHNLSEYPESEHIDVLNLDFVMTVVPNQKNINLLVKMKKLGYYVIVWSRTGSDWAEKVCKALDIDQYVDQYLCKPLFMADDRQPQEWTQILNRDSKTGENK